MVFEEDGDPFDYPYYFVELNVVGIIFRNWKLYHLLKLNAIKITLQEVEKIAEANVLTIGTGKNSHLKSE